MALTQMQLIKSLNETIRWFERELQWGVAPSELSHLVGRLAEIFTAIHCNGQLAVDPKQTGYDVVAANGDRYSVNCVATKLLEGEVNFTRAVLENVDRVSILFLNLEEMEIEILLDCAVEELGSYITSQAGGKLIVSLESLKRKRKPNIELKVIRQVVYKDYTLRELENGYVDISLYGSSVDHIRPVLNRLAVELGVSLHNGMRSSRNVKLVGSLVIDAVEEQDS